MYKKITLVSAIVFTLLGTGCANYRTNSDLSFKSVDTSHMTPEVPVIQSSEIDGNYKIIGDVKAVVKKLSAFHATPTRAQADLVLAHKAKKMGADAVVDVNYNVTIGIDTWGQMTADGKAVKIEDE